jgi:hypothetical protein
MGPTLSAAAAAQAPAGYRVTDCANWDAIA